MKDELKDIQTPENGVDATEELKLGEILRDAGLVSEKQMQKMLEEHRASGQSLGKILKREVSLDSLKTLMKYEVQIPFFKKRSKEDVKDVLLKSGIISDEELVQALDETEENDRKLGELLVSKGYINSKQLQTAMAEQEKTGLPLWRVLLNLKMVTHSDISNLMKNRIGRGISRAKEELLIEVLLNAGLLKQEDLDKARLQQDSEGTSVINYLVEKKIISMDKIIENMKEILDISFVNLKKISPDPEMAYVIPEHIVRMYRILPIRVEGEKLLLGMVDPLDEVARQKAQMITGYFIKPCMISRSEWEKTIGRLFQSKATGGTVSEMEKMLRAGTRSGVLSTHDASAVQLASSIIDGAINARATDIHLEPQTTEMRVRYRIDGLLYDVMSVPKEMELPVISRLKLLSNMDITEKRKPQDGHFTMSIRHQTFNFRTASIPTYLGEKLTIRFLDESRVMTGLKQLGWDKDDLTRVKQLIKKPYGMILVTGPIGSGKTTTLYAALNYTNVLNKNIITIEDPVEYRLAGVNQVQVNPDIGLTFKQGLRAILRHDADIIMVGEVRDQETAKVATWAALTGQLVFCTLHTKDAAGAVTMLGNLGVEYFLIAGSLIGVIAQRLVRKLCPYCKKMVPPDPAICKQLGWDTNSSMRIGQAVGCDKCFNTGFIGRTGIFEVLEVDDEIRQLILSKAGDDAIREAALKNNMKSLMENGIKKIEQGETTPEEVLREIML